MFIRARRKKSVYLQILFPRKTSIQVQIQTKTAEKEIIKFKDKFPWKKFDRKSEELTCFDKLAGSGFAMLDCCKKGHCKKKS